MVNLLKIVIMNLYYVLPTSPFSSIAGEFEQFDFLPYLNWFIPFDRCAQFTLLWCAALFAVYNFDMVKDVVKKIKNAFFS